MGADNKIKLAFEADAKNRHAAGLPLEQARLAALVQLVRDARSGLLDSEAVAQVVIAEEMAHGRSAEAAKAHAEAVCAGERRDFAQRDSGLPKGKVRKPTPRLQTDEFNCDPAMSSRLSHWLNGTRSTQ